MKKKSQIRYFYEAHLRCMKHFPDGKYEAQLRCMKRDPKGSHVFLPKWGIKLCSNSLIYLPKFANLDFLEDTIPDATLKNEILRF